MCGLREMHVTDICSGDWVDWTQTETESKEQKLNLEKKRFSARVIQDVRSHTVVAIITDNQIKCLLLKMAECSTELGIDLPLAGRGGGEEEEQEEEEEAVPCV